MMNQPTYTLEQIAEACMIAEVPDSKYEAISIELMKATPAPQCVPAGWISVNDRPPPEGSPVLVYVPGCLAQKVWIDTWQEQFECPVGFSSVSVPTGQSWDDHEFEEISHWMPIPPAPAPEKEGGDRG